MSLMQSNRHDKQMEYSVQTQTEKYNDEIMHGKFRLHT
jgi:hypothetical protein